MIRLCQKWLKNSKILHERFIEKGLQNANIHDESRDLLSSAKKFDSWGDPRSIERSEAVNKTNKRLNVHSMFLLSTSHMISLVSIAATILSLQNLSFVTAALPPGYEDVMWCPEGYCRRAVNPGDGFVGPARAFNECYSPSTDSVVDEVWTGELSETVAPEGWIENPASCGVYDADETPEEALVETLDETPKDDSDQPSSAKAVPTIALSMGIGALVVLAAN